MAYYTALNKANFLSSIQFHSNVMTSNDMIKPNINELIGYRGDSRPPIEIFSQGFRKKHPHLINPIFTHGKIEPNSAVCFSRNYEMASIFPESNTKISYVYAFLPVNYFNTQRVQARLIKKLVSHHPKDDITKIKGFYFADEMCTNNVPAENILFALKICDREEIIDVIHNCFLNPVIKVRFQSLFKKFESLKNTILPDVDDNIYSSNGNKMLEKYQEKPVVKIELPKKRKASYCDYDCDSECDESEFGCECDCHVDYGSDW